MTKYKKSPTKMPTLEELAEGRSLRVLRLATGTRFRVGPHIVEVCCDARITCVGCIVRDCGECQERDGCEDRVLCADLPPCNTHIFKEVLQ